MAAPVWPTHRAKTRNRRSFVIRKRKQTRKARRLLSNGKRSEVSYS
jgi:hypothetical protein